MSLIVNIHKKFLCECQPSFYASICCVNGLSHFVLQPEPDTFNTLVILNENTEKFTYSPIHFYFSTCDE